MTRPKRIEIIVNPASGKDEPILSYINRAFKDSPIEWEIKITKKKGDAVSFTQSALRRKIDMIAVYGGDGTVMEVARALYKKSTPMAIIPGGTSNVMAHELKLPIRSEEALELIVSGKGNIKKVDMGLINKTPFLIRVSTGSFAQLIADANRESKRKFGQVAYGVSTLKQVNNFPMSRYKMRLDGKEITAEGVALVIANSGHTGIPNLSFTHSNSPFDGMLDILLVKKFDIRALMSLTNALITDKKTNDVLDHWLARDVHVRIKPATTIFCDDAPIKSTHLHVKIVPEAISIIVPHDSKKTNN